uniref:Uncharacterized protein n=1 Tax=Oryza brachyantha TaxID=4533 RepID=J3LBM9_ORYBR
MLCYIGMKCSYVNLLHSGVILLAYSSRVNNSKSMAYMSILIIVFFPHFLFFL